MLKDNGTYEVGYGKPPKETRFVAGKSGNPNGRPKGSRNLATIVLQESRARVRVTGPHGSQEITKLEAAVRQLANKSAQGDLRATRDLIALVQGSEESVESNVVSTDLNEADKKVMEGILKRMNAMRVDSLNGSSTSAK